MGSYDNSGGNYDWSAYYAQTGGSSSQYPQHQEYSYEDVNNPQGGPAQGDPAQGGSAHGGTYPFAGQTQHQSYASGSDPQDSGAAGCYGGTDGTIGPTKTDNEGNTRKGYRFCCGKWFKKGRDETRHRNTHERPHSCQSETIVGGVRYTCDKSTASVKELNEHYYVYHKEWAKANGIPDPRRRCMICSKILPKAGSIKKHLKTHPDCNTGLADLPTDSQTLPYSGSEGDNDEGSYQG
ncbi:unnamed protein product [Clonostachys chloroleuca]|uniref:C2H2-type domain-containing protein n=1 Tax=Clonostachys chloroleuca TaxID=1926264 RepID=A0AA35MH66_9HYPO|nr:unnamed protein product [Clonostachys chloroleuca]